MNLCLKILMQSMEQALTDISTGASFLFKDGGFASIEDVLGYGNELKILN